MSAKSNFDECRLGLLVVFSDDMHKAAEFYKAIGMRFDRHSHPPCGEHYSSVDSEWVFEIYPHPDDREKMTPITFGLHVRSVDRAIEAVLAHGGCVKRKAHAADWGRTATVIDCDGNFVILMEKAEQAVELALSDTERS